VKNGSVVSIWRVLTKRGVDDERIAPDFAEATSRILAHRVTEWVIALTLGYYRVLPTRFRDDPGLFAVSNKVGSKLSK
jgi:hypothetical protein